MRRQRISKQRKSVYSLESARYLHKGVLATALVDIILFYSMKQLKIRLFRPVDKFFSDGSIHALDDVGEVVLHLIIEI